MQMSKLVASDSETVGVDNGLGDFVQRLVADLKDKQIVLFGAASSGKRVLLNLTHRGVDRTHVRFYDSNPDKWGREIEGIQVLSMDQFTSLPKDTPVLISSHMYAEIRKNLQQMGFVNVHFIRDLLLMRHMLPKFDDRFMRIVEEVKEICNMGYDEMYTLYSSMLAVADLPGDVAEVGVYKGGSARILCELKAAKELHLFDTFEGLPEAVITNDDVVKPKWLNDVILTDVQQSFVAYSGVHFYQGLFPTTAISVVDKQFSLVNLDTDIFQGTYEGLRFFWPRMVKGGRIISHDYVNADCPGVKRAFHQFFKGRLELIVEIADGQALVIKDA